MIDDVFFLFSNKLFISNLVGLRLKVFILQIVLFVVLLQILQWPLFCPYRDKFLVFYFSNLFFIHFFLFFFTLVFILFRMSTTTLFVFLSIVLYYSFKDIYTRKTNAVQIAKLIFVLSDVK